MSNARVLVSVVVVVAAMVCAWHGPRVVSRYRRWIHRRRLVRGWVVVLVEDLVVGDQLHSGTKAEPCSGRVECVYHDAGLKYGVRVDLSAPLRKWHCEWGGMVSVMYPRPNTVAP